MVITCCICGSVIEQIEYVVDNFIQCPYCNVFRHHPLPSPDLHKQRTKNQMISACYNLKTRNVRLSIAQHQLDLVAPYIQRGVVYDVGAAAGFFLKVARDSGWEIYGNEISTSAIKWAHENYNINIDYGYIEELEIPHDYFDLIVFWNTLEHVLNPQTTVQKCYRMLREHGIILVLVPIKDRSDLLSYLESGHMTEFNCIALQKLFNNNGFELIVDNGITVTNGIQHVTHIYKKV